jgi:hypothetical protein
MKNLLRLTAFVLLGTSALAGPVPSAGPTDSVKLIKLPNGDYTVPMRELEGSGEEGKITLHPEGLNTLVTVYVNGKHRHHHRFSLKSGSDCANAGATNAVPLKPAITGEPSQTLVSLPIENFSSKNYVIDMQNATERRQFEEACAHL